MTTALRSRLLLVIVALSAALGHPQAATRNFLWKITGKANAIYLAGSVHMLPKDAYPLSAALDNAFKDSDLLVEEVDIGEMLAPEMQFQVLAKAKLPDGQAFEKIVSPATYAALSKHIADLGMPIEPLKQLKPWMLAIMLEATEWQKAGLDPELGLDKHFYDLAQSAGKAFQGLESAEYQLSRFDEMTPEQQDRFLAETLKGLDTEVANITKLADAWKSGDAPTVERLVLTDLKDDPIIYRRLLVERNQNWLPKLESLFARPGRAFVVVGAAHLVGPDGLLALLKAKGYAVEQL